MQMHGRESLSRIRLLRRRSEFFAALLLLMYLLMLLLHLLMVQLLRRLMRRDRCLMHLQGSGCGSRVPGIDVRSPGLELLHGRLNRRRLLLLLLLFGQGVQIVERVVEPSIGSRQADG